MRFDPPSGLVFDRKALSVLRLLKSDISCYQTDGLTVLSMLAHRKLLLFL